MSLESSPRTGARRPSHGFAREAGPARGVGAGCRSLCVVALLARVLLDRGRSGREVVAVGAGLLGVVDVEGVAERASIARDRSGLDSAVARRACLGLGDHRLLVMAGLAARGIEPDDLPLRFLGVWPVARGALDLPLHDVR